MSMADDLMQRLKSRSRAMINDLVRQHVADGCHDVETFTLDDVRRAVQTLERYDVHKGSPLRFFAAFADVDAERLRDLGDPPSPYRSHRCDGKKRIAKKWRRISESETLRREREYAAAARAVLPPGYLYDRGSFYAVVTRSRAPLGLAPTSSWWVGT